MLFNALTPELHHVLTQAQLPTVLLNVGLKPDDLNRNWPCLCVDPDDDGGTELVTRRLLELGHRRIAFVEDLSPNPHLICFPQQRHAFVMALFALLFQARALRTR